MSAVAIECRGMSREFGGRFVVQDVDLQVPTGQIFGFLGPNGCGKSTSIRMLTGLLTPSRGDIKVLGYQLPQQAEALKPKIGYMTQKFSLFDSLTVHENLEFVSQLYGLKAQERRQRIAELQHIYHLAPYQAQLAGSLSGGQKQRLALAAATLHRPDLLFLDEPTSAVDPENRREFWERLFDLSEAGTTILVSTHYMDEAERCHGLAILEEGHLRAMGSPQQLMDDMPTTVVEIQGDGLRMLRQQLLGLEGIVSAAQLGNTLRVLVKRQVAEPVAWLHQHAGLAYQMQLTRPSLEDVFVSCTGGRRG